MYRQRTQKAWGHTAHRGWARLFLDRARDLITNDPAHHSANGTTMPTDEDDQDGHFFFNHPERGGVLRRTQPLIQDPGGGRGKVRRSPAQVSRAQWSWRKAR